MAKRNITSQRYKCEICKKNKVSSYYFKAGRTKAGYYHICKSCLQLKTKQNNIEYVKHILKEMDIVFIKKFWDKVYFKYGDSSFGHYLKGTMLNPNYRYLSYNDSEFEDSSDESDYEEPVYNETWRGTFTVQDLNNLEKYYNELHRDYRITTTNHKDYARKIAKASLAMDKAYERMLNDRDEKAGREFKELKSIFDDLCKSAKFSENTRSANDVGLGSFGVIFNMIEKSEWIPQHKPLKKDAYDKLLDQFANIEKSL
jgi:hypothetical protein